MTQALGAGRTAAAPSSAAQTDTSHLLQRLGGRRGLVEGALPPLVFVAVNALVGLLAGPAAAGQPLWWALAAAAGTTVVLIGSRVVQGQAVNAALRGLAGLAVAAAVAAWTGQARDFFLPGIYVDAAYAVAFAASAVLGHPLVAYLYVTLFRRHRDWRTDPRLRRLFTAATLGWAVIYALRVAATTYLYRADAPELLALTKLSLGWPLTVVGVMATVAAVRRVGRSPAYVHK
jgi:hypothetical protein